MDPCEALLLHADIHTSSRTLNFILKRWSVVESSIHFTPVCDKIPGQLFVIQLLALMQEAREGVGDQKGAIIAYTRVRRIFVPTDLWANDGWLTKTEVHGQLRSN